MNKIKELEKFLSSYRIIKADIEDLKLREKEENINLSCEIERLQSKVNRIDNAMNILDMKERDIIKERYLEGMGRQSWKLIAKSLFLSESWCLKKRKTALNKLKKRL
ncbi:sigma-70 family RNA polymerase sigma factor [Clostridium perfringens]|uniref:sigma-70 family RNA polymerase sigma factor n=1 Tax=Clostridium perfringens TaxID=1502 RepID=UPI0024BCBB97|nr:sigma-70 family RNA polymerase sigma factor [Clostridium perfringens]